MKIKNILVSVLSICMLLNVMCMFVHANEDQTSLFFDDFENYQINSTYLTGRNAAIGTSWITKSLDMGYDNLAKYGIFAVPKDSNNKVLMLESRAEWGAYWAFPEIKCTSAVLNTSNSYIIDTDIYTDASSVGVGIGFMVHNGGKNFYELYFPGDLSSNGNWSLNKVTSGTRVAMTQSTVKTKLSSGVWYNLQIIIDGADISWTMTNRTTGLVINNLCGSCMISEPFQNNISSSMKIFAAGQVSKYSCFDNVEIKYWDTYVNGKKERNNVLYFDISKGKHMSSEGIVDLKGNYCVRRFQSDKSTGKTCAVEFSNDKNEWIPLGEITFDNTGKWINTITSEKFRYIKFSDMTIFDDIKIFSEVFKDDICSLVIDMDTDFICRFNGEDCNASSKWTSDNTEIFSIENGIAKGGKNGTANLTVSNNGKTFNAAISILGEIAQAEQDGTEQQYITKKKPIVDAINEAITNKDAASLKAIIDNEESVDEAERKRELKNIRDFDYNKIKNLDDAHIIRLAEAIIRYPIFKVAEIDDLKHMIYVFEAEISLFEMDNLEDIDIIEQVILKNINNYNLNLDNIIYIQNKQEVLNTLKQTQFKSILDLKEKFTESYVIIPFINTISYWYAGDILENCKTEIGYDLQKFEKISDKGDLYQQLFTNRDSLTTIDKLRMYIDSYKPTIIKKHEKGHGPNGGSSKSSNVTISSDIIDIEPKTDETTVVKKVQIYLDVPTDNWAYEGTRYLTAKEAVNGYENGNFMPDNNITRAEFLKMLMLGFDIEIPKVIGNEKVSENTSEVAINKDENEILTEENVFNDVSKTDWYYSYIAVAKENKVIMGDSEKNCKPNELITRQEMVTLVYRVIELQKKILPKTSDLIKFKDTCDISEWAFTPIAKLQLAGIVNGKDSTIFAPLQNSTRAEAAKVICEAFEKASVKEEITIEK